MGRWFKTDLRLYVDGRDRTKLVQAMKTQVNAVHLVLADHEEWREVAVTPALLFMSDDNWSLLDRRPLRFGEVYVLWGKALGKLIRAKGTDGRIDLIKLERMLATALPSA